MRVTDLLISDGPGPAQDSTRVLDLLEANSAVSVSGDPFRFVEIEGERYAHVIDPRTGLGVTQGRIACVRGERGIDTDPLATAGLIIEEEAWREALAQVPGCQGWVYTDPSR